MSWRRCARLRGGRRSLCRRAAGMPRDSRETALRVEHAEDVVVGLDEERGGIGKGLVEGEPAGVGVAVRRDDGQVAYGLVESCGDGACLVRPQETTCSHPESSSCLPLRSQSASRKRQHRKRIKDFAAPRTKGGIGDRLALEEIGERRKGQGYTESKQNESDDADSSHRHGVLLPTPFEDSPSDQPDQDGNRGYA